MKSTIGLVLYWVGFGLIFASLPDLAKGGVLCLLGYIIFEKIDYGTKEKNN